MKIIDKRVTFTFHAFEIHKVYRSRIDHCLYVVAKVDEHHILLNLNCMEGSRMVDLTVKSDEFYEVNYEFIVRD